MVKYRHRNCNKLFTPATFCYDLPPPVFFERMFSEAQPLVNFPFGMTLVIGDDQYCKQTGRTYSLKNMKVRPFTLTNIKLNNGRQEYYLTTEIDGLELVLKVLTQLETGHYTRLDWVDFKSFDDSDYLYE